MSTTDLEGIFWPCMPEGDDSLPWVQRADDEDKYRDDIEAAEALAKLTGTRVMFATLDGEELEEGFTLAPANLRPFVFAFAESNAFNDQALLRGPDGLYTPAHFDKWVKEAQERFGSRRDRYDEAVGITRFPVGSRARIKTDSVHAYAGEEGVIASRAEASAAWIVLDSKREGTIVNLNQLETVTEREEG